MDAENFEVLYWEGKPSTKFLRKAGLGAWKRPGGDSGTRFCNLEDLHPFRAGRTGHAHF